MTEDDKQYLIMWEDEDTGIDDRVFVPRLDHKTLRAAMNFN